MKILVYIQRKIKLLRLKHELKRRAKSRGHKVSLFFRLNKRVTF